jgi:hypothetical protein
MDETIISALEARKHMAQAAGAAANREVEEIDRLLKARQLKT